MKNALKISWSRLLGAVLGILGFGGCFVTSCRKEYGCPSADYKLVGEVKDAKGNGIEGIRVVYRPFAGNEEIWANDTLYSDAKGHFERERLKSYSYDTQNASVIFEDVDGSEHGSFKTKVVERDDLVIEQSGKGDKHWYYGEYTIRAEAVLEEDN